MVASCGVMVMDCSVAGPTLSVPEPEIDPTDAVMVELPTATAPASPVLLMLAIVPSEEVHVATVVRSCVVLSLKVPVAVNC